MAEQNDPVNLKFQYPSVETLRHLFAATDAFCMLTPWQWMGDHEVVAVRDPESERVAYCIVMGGQGLDLIAFAPGQVDAVAQQVAVESASARCPAAGSNAWVFAGLLRRQHRLYGSG